jgi:hypothetical protein
VADQASQTESIIPELETLGPDVPGIVIKQLGFASRSARKAVSTRRRLRAIHGSTSPMSGANWRAEWRR